MIYSQLEQKGKLVYGQCEVTFFSRFTYEKLHCHFIFGVNRENDCPQCKGNPYGIAKCFLKSACVTTEISW